MKTEDVHYIRTCAYILASILSPHKGRHTQVRICAHILISTTEHKTVNRTCAHILASFVSPHEGRDTEYAQIF